MLDDIINTVFTAEKNKIEFFTSYLDDLEGVEKIHSHFVDGTKGEYTSAAKMFKRN